MPAGFEEEKGAELGWALGNKWKNREMRSMKQERPGNARPPRPLGGLVILFSMRCKTTGRL